VDLNDEIFYNKEHKKNFKFALFLYFLKEGTKIGDEFVYELLQFGDKEFMAFNFYGYFKEKEIIDIYESLFNNIGFDFMQKEIILDEILSVLLDTVDACGISNLHSQLFFCLFQKNIKPNIIKYLSGKFIEYYGNDILEEELVRIIIKFLHIYGRAVCIFRKPKLLSFDIIAILSYLLPNLNENSIAKLQEHYFKNGMNFFNFQMKLFYSQYNLKLSSNYENIPSYLFNLNEFKIMDYFFKFNFIQKNFNEHLIISFLISIRKNFDHLLKILCTFVLYFLRNNFFTAQEVMNSIHIFNNEYKERVPYTSEQISKMNQKLKLICLYEQKTPKTLLFLSKQAIKNCFKVITFGKIKQLDLPENLKINFLDTELIDESLFDKIYNQVE